MSGNTEASAVRMCLTKSCLLILSLQLHHLEIADIGGPFFLGFTLFWSEGFTFFYLALKPTVIGSFFSHSC